MTLPINPRDFYRPLRRTSSIDEVVNLRSGSFGSGLNGASSNYSDSLRRNTAIRQNQSEFDYNDAAAAISRNSSVDAATTTIGSFVSNTASNVAAGANQIVGNITAGISGAVNTAVGNVAGLVGAVTNIIGLPQASKVFSTQEDMVSVISPEEGDWRVQIKVPDLGGGSIYDFGYGESSPGGNIIFFPVIPTMTLAHKANYTEVDIVHSNYPFVAYKNSRPDDITISCEWPVESIVDAKEWLTMVRIGRTLTKMYYGLSQNAGNPPPICTLKGFSFAENPVVLPDMPVICKSFQFDLKDDVSYVGVEKEYVPRVSSVSFTFATVYPRVAQRSFDISQFAQGSGVFRF